MMTQIMEDVVKTDGDLTEKEIEAIESLQHLCEQCLIVSKAKKVIKSWKTIIEEESE